MKSSIYAIRNGKGGAESAALICCPCATNTQCMVPTMVTCYFSEHLQLTRCLNGLHFTGAELAILAAHWKTRETNARIIYIQVKRQTRYQTGTLADAWRCYKLAISLFDKDIFILFLKSISTVGQRESLNKLDGQGRFLACYIPQVGLKWDPLLGEPHDSS